MGWKKDRWVWDGSLLVLDTGEWNFLYSQVDTPEKLRQEIVHLRTLPFHTREIEADLLIAVRGRFG